MDGYADIYRMYFLINPNAAIPANTCHGYYDRATNALYLYNDALTVLLGPLTRHFWHAAEQPMRGERKHVVTGIGQRNGPDGQHRAGRAGRVLGTNQNVYLWVKDNEGHDTGWSGRGRGIWVRQRRIRPRRLRHPGEPNHDPQTFTFTGGTWTATPISTGCTS